MTEAQSISQLPNNWILTTLGEIRLDKSSSINPLKTPEKQFELYSVPSFESKTPEILFGREIGSNKITVDEDTVLLCKINPRINRVWIVQTDSDGQKIASTEWIPFFKIQGINPKFLSYYLQQNTFRNFLAANVSGVGGSLMRVRPATLAKYPFPLAPTKEQERIVGKVEELFSFLDAGVASLRAVQVQLKRYRQAVLKAAFEGKLTQQWQKESKEGDLSVTELLKKLYEEKTPKERMIVSRSPEADLQLNDLPSGWVWTTLENLTAPGRPIRYGIIKPGPDTIGGVPYVRVKEMKTGQIDLAILRRCNKEHAKKFAAATLKAGDILISKDGTIGKVAIVPPELEGGNITQHVLRLSPSNLINRNFLARFIESPQCQRRIVGETRGVALQGINVDDFRKLPIPLPPLLEQTKIVEAIDLFYSDTEELEKSVKTNFILCENLRMAILKNAFEGKLVPQDCSDEPAEKLLEHIKDERLNNKSKNNNQLELSQYVK